MVLHVFSTLQYLNLENHRVQLTYCLWYLRMVGQRAVPQTVLLTSPGCACVPGKPSPVLCLSASARKYSEIVSTNTMDLAILWWWCQWKCHRKIELTFILSKICHYLNVPSYLKFGKKVEDEGGVERGWGSHPEIERILFTDLTDKATKK